jgi:hypothetical protein
MVNSIKPGQRNVSDLPKERYFKNQNLGVGTGIQFVVLQGTAREQIGSFVIRFCLSHSLVIDNLFTTPRFRLKTDYHGALKSMLSIVGRDKTFFLAPANNVKFHNKKPKNKNKANTAMNPLNFRDSLRSLNHGLTQHPFLEQVI